MVIEGDIARLGYMTKKLNRVTSDDPGLVKDDAYATRSLNAGIGTLEVLTLANPSDVVRLEGKFNDSKRQDTAAELDMFERSNDIVETVTELVAIWSTAIRASGVINLLPLQDVRVYERGLVSSGIQSVAKSFESIGVGDAAFTSGQANGSGKDKGSLGLKGAYLTYATRRNIMPPSVISEIMETGIKLLARVMPGQVFGVDQAWWDHITRPNELHQTSHPRAQYAADLLQRKQSRVQADLGVMELAEAMKDPRAELLTAMAIITKAQQNNVSTLAGTKSANKKSTIMTPRQLAFTLECLLHLKQTEGVVAHVGLESPIMPRDNKYLKNLFAAIEIYLPMLKNLIGQSWAPFCETVAVSSSSNAWSIVGTPVYTRIPYTRQYTTISVAGRDVPVMSPIVIPEVRKGAQGMGLETTDADPNAVKTMRELESFTASDITSFYRTGRTTSKLISIYETMQAVSRTPANEDIALFSQIVTDIEMGVKATQYFMPGGGAGNEPPLVAQAVTTQLKTKYPDYFGYVGEGKCPVALPVAGSAIRSGAYEGHHLVAGYQLAMADPDVDMSADACWPWSRELSLHTKWEEEIPDRKVTYPAEVL